MPMKRSRLIYDSINMGADFALMATRYSEDPSSAKSGGKYPGLEQDA